MCTSTSCDSSIIDSFWLTCCSSWNSIFRSQRLKYRQSNNSGRSSDTSSFRCYGTTLNLDMIVFFLFRFLILDHLICFFILDEFFYFVVDVNSKTIITTIIVIKSFRQSTGDIISSQWSWKCIGTLEIMVWDLLVYGHLSACLF